MRKLRWLGWVLLGLVALVGAAGLAGWFWWMHPRAEAGTATRYGAFRRLFAAGLPSQPPPQPLQAGIGVIDITPRRPVPLAGYGARHGRLSTGVHDPIHAKALLLDNGGTRLGIVTTDLIGMSLGMKRQVLRRVGRMLRLTDDTLLICASHSHSATGGIAKSAVAQLATGRYDPRLEKELTDALCRALTQAGHAMAPATAGWAQVQAPKFVQNRRKGETFTDPVVSILRVDGPGRKMRALLVNYAAHGTSLGPQSMLVSADWQGYLQRSLEQTFPGAVALYTNGAEGDQAPRGAKGLSGFQEAQFVGQGLANLALPALRTIKMAATLPLAGQAVTVKLPRTALGLLVARQTQVQALGIGDMALVAVPGEMAAGVGADLKRAVGRLGFPQTAIVGLANDHLGYIISPRQYRAGGYEREISFFGPGLARLIGASAQSAAMALAVRMAPAPPVKVQGDVRQCAAGRSWVEQGQRIVYLRGNAYELGYQHGALLRPEIGVGMRGLAGLLGEETGVPPALSGLLLKLLRRPVYTLERYLPAESILETYGLAKGAGIDYDRALLMQVLLSIAEQPSAKQALGLGASCSNIVALGPAAKGGVPVYGRNLDWGAGETLKHMAIVALYDPAVGRRFVVIGWAGQVGCLTAMNDAGLCIGEESVSSPQDCSLDGRPLFLVLREAIQFSSDLGQAKRVAIDTPGTCGYHITILDSAARRAETIERTAHHWAVRYPQGGLLLGCLPRERTAAEYAGNVLPNPVISRSDSSSNVRYARLAELSRASYGQVDEKVLLACMGDRIDAQTGRLELSLRAVCNRDTLHSVVWHPTDRRFWVAQGQVPAPPGGYRGYDLDDLFAAAARVPSPPGRG